MKARCANSTAHREPRMSEAELQIPPQVVPEPRNNDSGTSIGRGKLSVDPSGLEYATPYTTTRTGVGTISRIILSAALLLFFASAAQGAVTVTIAPLPSAQITAEGFMPAELSVSDPNSELLTAVRAVLVRRAAGGPSMFYRASVAPGASGRFRVALPILSVRESYVVRLLGEASPEAPALIELKTTAQTDNVAAVEAARARLVDPPAYDDHIEDLPRWPGWAIRNVCLAAAGLLVAMGAVLLIHRSTWRALAACVAVAGTTTVVWISLSHVPLVPVRRSGEVLIVTSRRTVTWSHPTKGLAPVYRRMKQMNADDMIYQPGGSMTMTLHPAEVRLFRLIDRTAKQTANTGGD